MLALLFTAHLPLSAQEKKKMTRKEKEAAWRAERLKKRAIEEREELHNDSIAFAQAVDALRNGSWALEASNVTFNNGVTRFVTQSTNFVSVNDGQGIVQTAFNNSNINSPNGLGGITLEGRVNSEEIQTDKEGNIYVGLDEVAEVLSDLPLDLSHMQEVHDAVTSSSDNGYDEEYTMKDLFESPGQGVGGSHTRSGVLYENPLRDLIEAHLRSIVPTKSGRIMDADAFLEALVSSDIQIYWPFSDRWDGTTMPIITFDPEDGSEINIGYRLYIEDDGSRRVEEVLVDEEMADKEPVWVVNRNSDAEFLTLDMLRREDPDWGDGGGSIIVKPGLKSVSSDEPLRSLVLKDFTMNRNYDSWFAGASEFFVKIGYLGDFTASTEAELRLYNPLVTDFMVVVKRSQVGIPQNFNAILMSDWSEYTDACAFMITEDDGGTRTEWVSKAKVFVEGKSYGLEITLPLNVRDDIVWRGKLAYEWIEQCSQERWPFGGVDLTFEILEN